MPHAKSPGDANTLATMGKPGKPGIVGQNIRRLLDEKGMGATELERRSGVPRSTINSLMNGGVREAQEETIAKLAGGLRVPAGELLVRSASTQDVEDLIRAFAKSPHAATLEPPFSERDAARLRSQGRFAWGEKRPKHKALRLLVMFLRDNADEEDRSV
jgi:transcriptional regulator with XRE-family HTH domain